MSSVCTGHPLRLLRPSSTAVTSSAEPVVGRARSAAVVGLAALEVNVEVSMSAGLPAFTVIGTLGAAARQAADRVRAALTATGVRLPARKILASFAPADVPTAGASFDLPLAVAVLVRLGVLPEAVADDSAFLGEAVGTICKDLTAHGETTVTGRPWRTTV